jgi:signal transduction histidine kinase
LQTIQAQADVEPGWVEYDISNPSTGQVQAKMSYVCGVDGLSMGCGVYKNLQAA